MFLDLRQKWRWMRGSQIETGNSPCKKITSAVMMRTDSTCTDPPPTAKKQHTEQKKKQLSLLTVPGTRSALAFRNGQL